MSDMLVRLYDLPPVEPAVQAAAAQGLTIRRGEPWEITEMIAFALEHFSQSWADQVQVAMLRQPISLFVADDNTKLVGFAAYHATRLDYFGPEGVLEEYRGRGLGKALVLSCLWAMFHEGYAYAIIGWAGPQDFYRKCVGAIVIPDSEPGVYWPQLRQPPTPGR